jgi:hypothetical protein
MSYTMELNNPKYNVSLSRVGAQGAKGTSVGNVVVDENDALMVTLVDGGGVVTETINAGTVTADLSSATSGYEFTGGFADRTTGQSGANDLGSNVQYTTTEAGNMAWRRFGFSAARQVANDVEYWGETDPAFVQSKGLFGGLYMPKGITNLIDYTDTSNSAAVTSGALQYSAADGSYDMSECVPGDRIQVRFSFNVVPQIANSTLEIGLIWSTRDSSDNVTFTFPLTTQPVFYGTGTQGVAYLNRVEMSAYIASNEDVNARALPAIRCDNAILIQPLTTLITVVR